MAITHAFAAEITKAERDENGDLIVHGKATGPDLDLDEQVCDPAWLREAMPEWAKWGNLREMHQPIAAGVGLECAAEGDDWWVKSQVVDEGTAKKIEAGALKGYSVGIKNARVVKDATAPGGRIVGGQIVEVSYVDRPCNPTATLAIAKAAGADAELAPVEAEDAEEASEDEGDDVDKAAKGSKDVAAEFMEFIRKNWVDWQAVKRNEDRDKDRERAVALVKAVGPNGEIDEAPDIEGGRQAIALIARLIKAEADELAAGELDESWDIALLLQAVDSLKFWLKREQAADAGTDGGDEGVTYVALEADADLGKSLTSEEKSKFTAQAKKDPTQHLSAAIRRICEWAKSGNLPTGTTRSDLHWMYDQYVAELKRRDPKSNAGGGFPGESSGKAATTGAGVNADVVKCKSLSDILASVKARTQSDEGNGDGKKKTTEADHAKFVSKDEIGDLVKAAVTEATKAAQERYDALAAELAKVKATPLPGGPVVTAATPRQHTAGTDLDKAAHYERMATAVQDPATAAGYRQLAAQHRAAAGQSH